MLIHKDTVYYCAFAYFSVLYDMPTYKNLNATRWA